MSGDLRLEGPGIGNVVASLAALTESAPSAEFAVIGGLAVLARLGGAHRVTDDLDTVATQHGDEPTVVEAVIVARLLASVVFGRRAAPAKTEVPYVRWRSQPFSPFPLPIAALGRP